MLRRRPRRTATAVRTGRRGSVPRRRCTSTATVINVLLAFSMHVLWPVLLAALLALVTALCTSAAIAAWRKS